MRTTATQPAILSLASGFSVQQLSRTNTANPLRGEIAQDIQRRSLPAHGVCQTGLPYRDPGSDTPLCSGRKVLLILKWNPAGPSIRAMCLRDVGLPFGPNHVYFLAYPTPRARVVPCGRC